MGYDWNFSRVLPYWQAFAEGIVTTLSLTVVVVVSGTVLGLILGLGLRVPVWRFILYPIVEAIRALPPLVLILFVYYLLTERIVGVAVPAFWTCAVAMTLNLAAFTAELVRAAVENTPRTAVDAGRALGMSQRQVTVHVVLPHVVREVIPGMTVLYIAMLKMTSLASVINVHELVYSAQNVITTIARSLEVWAIVGIVYLVMVIPAAHLARRLERWVGRSTGTSGGSANLL